jgi:hypothetical protein
VISITVSGMAGKQTWFQGTVPDPTGLTIKALWADGPNKGDIVEYTAAEFTANGFSISPNILDEPGAYPAPGQFRVVHKDSPNVQSQEIDYEGVIPILGVTGGTVDKLYADQNPLTKLIGTPIKLNYMWDSTVPSSGKATAPYNLGTVTVTPTTKYYDTTIYMNSAYPLWDMVNIASTNKVNVKFGYIKGTSTQTKKDGTIAVTEYMQVVDIQVATPLDPEFFVYDDDVAYAVAPAATAAAMPKDLDKLLEKVSFNVTYQKGKAGQSGNNPIEPGTVTWKEFKDNVAFAKLALSGQGPNAGGNIPGSANPINWGNDGQTKANREAKQGWTEADILIIDDDDTTWKIWLEYVPREYLLSIGGTPTGAGAAYVARVDVRIPVAEFQNEITVKSRHGLDQALIPYHSTPLIPMTDDWLNVIADRWVLTGQYNLGSRKLEPRVITWASSLFHYGNDSGGAGINLLAKTLSGNASWASYSVQTERDFALPIYYRGELAEQDDTVQVEIFRKSSNPATW